MCRKLLCECVCVSVALYVISVWVLQSISRSPCLSSHADDEHEMQQHENDGRWGSSSPSLWLFNMKQAKHVTVGCNSECCAPVLKMSPPAHNKLSSAQPSFRSVRAMLADNTILLLTLMYFSLIPSSSSRSPPCRWFWVSISGSLMRRPSLQRPSWAVVWHHWGSDRKTTSPSSVRHEPSGS